MNDLDISIEKHDASLRKLHDSRNRINAILGLGSEIPVLKRHQRIYIRCIEHFVNKLNRTI